MPFDPSNVAANLVGFNQSLNDNQFNNLQRQEFLGKQQGFMQQMRQQAPYMNALINPQMQTVATPQDVSIMGPSPPMQVPTPMPQPAQMPVAPTNPRPGQFGQFSGAYEAFKMQTDLAEKLKAKRLESFTTTMTPLAEAAEKTGDNERWNIIKNKARKFGEMYDIPELINYADTMEATKFHKGGKTVLVDFSDPQQVMNVFSKDPELAMDLGIDINNPETMKNRDYAASIEIKVDPTTGQKTLGAIKQVYKPGNTSSKTLPIAGDLTTDIRNMLLGLETLTDIEKQAIEQAPKDYKYKAKKVNGEIVSVEILSPSAAAGGRGMRGFIQHKYIPGAFFNRENGKTYVDIVRNGTEERVPLDTLTTQEQSKYWIPEIQKLKQKGGMRAVNAYVAATTYKAEADELLNLRVKLLQKNPSAFAGVGSKIKGMNHISQLVKMNTSDNPELAEFLKGTTLLADVLQNAVGSAQGGQWAFELAAKLLDPSLPTEAYEATINKHMRTLETKAGGFSNVGDKPGAPGYQERPKFKGETDTFKVNDLKTPGFKVALKETASSKKPFFIFICLIVLLF